MLFLCVCVCGCAKSFCLNKQKLFVGDFLEFSAGDLVGNPSFLRLGI